MQKDKGSKIGWANKQKETLDIGVSKKSAGVIRLPRLNCYALCTEIQVFAKYSLTLSPAHSRLNRLSNGDIAKW